LLHWHITHQQTLRGMKPVFHFPSWCELLGTLLTTDAQAGGRYLQDAVEALQSGRELMVEITGNVCSVLVGRERVVVMDALSPDGIGKACVVEFDDFVRMLEAWRDALQAAETMKVEEDFS